MFPVGHTIGQQRGDGSRQVRHGAEFAAGRAVVEVLAHAGRAAAHRRRRAARARRHALRLRTAQSGVTVTTHLFNTSHNNYICKIIILFIKDF